MLGLRTPDTVQIIHRSHSYLYHSVQSFRSAHSALHLTPTWNKYPVENKNCSFPTHFIVTDESLKIMKSH